MHGLLLAACIAAVLITAGCTNAPQAPATLSATAPSTPAPSVAPTPLTNGTSGSCSNDVCSYLPPTSSPGKGTSLRIEASPQRYSPIMSSTPGIGLALNASGFNASAAEYAWNATYGQFLSWNAPDYTVHQLGGGTSNAGGKLYWTFTEKPAVTKDPVVITVTAKDHAAGNVLGTSTVLLAWDGDNAVTVQEIR
ncbi:MAG TPA: hypothetical protein VHN82_09195 [Methanoregula sp.]|nr:hypothetical protein [Methanoregula sp.]